MTDEEILDVAHSMCVNFGIFKEGNTRDFLEFSRALIAKARECKPLEWQQPEDALFYAYACTGIGVYEVWQKTEGGFYGAYFDGSMLEYGARKSIESAKRLAQSDHDKRVLSRLVYGGDA